MTARSIGGWLDPLKRSQSVLVDNEPGRAVRADALTHQTELRSIGNEGINRPRPSGLEKVGIFLRGLPAYLLNVGVASLGHLVLYGSIFLLSIGVSTLLLYFPLTQSFLQLLSKKVALLLLIRADIANTFLAALAASFFVLFILNLFNLLASGKLHTRVDTSLLARPDEYGKRLRIAPNQVHFGSLALRYGYGERAFHAQNDANAFDAQIDFSLIKHVAGSPDRDWRGAHGTEAVRLDLAGDAFLMIHGAYFEASGSSQSEGEVAAARSAFIDGLQNRIA